jgi:hypothetical protein
VWESVELGDDAIDSRKRAARVAHAHQRTVCSLDGEGDECTGP